MYHILKGGHCAVLECPTQNLNIEIIIQTQKYLSIPSVNKQAVSQWENKVPEHCVKLERW